MGCGLSKTSSTVHPFSPDKDLPAHTAAPASTPEPTNYEELPSLPGQLLQSLDSQRPPLVRQSQVTSTDCVDGDSTEPCTQTSTRKDDKNHRLSTETSGGNSSSPDPLASLLSHPAANRSPFSPAMPLNSATRQYGTDSQVEFFKMLDKRIDEGPDYSTTTGRGRASSTLTHRQSH